jgi:tRNA/tmRNA/rRNA uracil-C5-methylase (TrmA/RlmC/RlmD family)
MGINAYRKLEYNYHDHKLQVNVAGFNQVNNYVADRLYEYVVELTQNKRVVNAYSGQGFLTYLISNNAKFVYGIEYQLAAHKMAEKVKEWNENYKITNIGRIL